MLTKNELESADAKRLDKVLDAFEDKVVQANVHCRVCYRYPWLQITF
jgi:hypothetical protein